MRKLIFLIPLAFTFLMTSCGDQPADNTTTVVDTTNASTPVTTPVTDENTTTLTLSTTNNTPNVDSSTQEENVLESTTKIATNQELPFI